MAGERRLYRVRIEHETYVIADSPEAAENIAVSEALGGDAIENVWAEEVQEGDYLPLEWCGRTAWGAEADDDTPPLQDIWPGDNVPGRRAPVGGADGRSA